jgi:ubiquinone biosynthesis protein
VRGIPSDDVAALDAAGIDRQVLAAKGVRVFYTQVFRDNFFHADAHAGNIWVDPASPADPRFIALDFGIMGQLPPRDQYYLAENFMAVFQRDYRRIAELHVEAGWVPAKVRIEDLEAATRAVCEPYFTRPLSEIALGEVVVKLFRTAQQYELTLQPQLILLQKTLLNIEGVGRLLDPRLDIWAVAHPVLEKILRERYSPAQLGRELRKRMPEIVTHAPDMPRLIREWLLQQTNGQHMLQMRSPDLQALVAASREGQRKTVYAILGTGLMVTAAVLYSLEAGGPRIFDVAAAVWIAALGALGAFYAAWPRRA